MLIWLMQVFGFGSVKSVLKPLRVIREALDKIERDQSSMGDKLNTLMVNAYAEAIAAGGLKAKIDNIMGV